MIIFFSRWLGRTFVRLFFPEDEFANIWLLSSGWENLAVLLPRLCGFQDLMFRALGCLVFRKFRIQNQERLEMMYKSFRSCHILNDSSSSYLLGLSTPHPKNKHISSLSMYNWMLDGCDNLCNPGFFCIRSFSKKHACQLLARWINRHLRLPKKWCAWPNAGDLSAPAEGPQMSIKVDRWRWIDILYIYIFVGWIPSLKPNITYLLKILEGVVVVWNIFFFDMGIKVI